MKVYNNLYSASCAYNRDETKIVSEKVKVKTETIKTVEREALDTHVQRHVPSTLTHF